MGTLAWPEAHSAAAARRGAPVTAARRGRGSLTCPGPIGSGVQVGPQEVLGGHWASVSCCGQRGGRGPPRVGTGDAQSPGQTQSALSTEGSGVQGGDGVLSEFPHHQPVTMTHTCSRVSEGRGPRARSPPPAVPAGDPLCAHTLTPCKPRARSPPSDGAPGFAVDDHACQGQRHRHQERHRHQHAHQEAPGRCGDTGGQVPPGPDVPRGSRGWEGPRAA